MVFNWVDLVIILVIAFFVAEAWRVGFWVILIDFISFLISLIVALRAYPLVSEVLRNNFSLTRSIANALGFLLTAIFCEAVLGILLARLLRKLPESWKTHKFVKAASVFPAFGEAIILISFFLTLVISFPIAPNIKKDVSESEIGGFIVESTTGLETRLSEIFGGLVEDSLTRLIVKPGSREILPVITESKDLSVDEAAESTMFALVNEERKKNGVHELTLRSELVPVARAHGQDMWERSYFGHVSPDGKDVGDRLEAAQVDYSVAGENLALSPTTNIAHSGLMNSEGHRENILSPDFERMGIGVVDNGVYGKMFVQIFSD